MDIFGRIEAVFLVAFMHLLPYFAVTGIDITKE